MTCREFKHDAAAHTLWELSRTVDPQLLGHAGECDSCSAWLNKQRKLAVPMEALRARTASLEAGPDVERALLRVFRQDTLHSADHVFEEVGKRAGSSRSTVTHLSTPMALRLSRFFEIGAYVAVAAALVVGVFLGIRLLQHSSSVAPIESKATPMHSVAPAQKPEAAATTATPMTASRGTRESHQTMAASRVRSVRRWSSRAAEAAASAAGDSSNDTDSGYVALMFCDPLSCAADTQVVRMRLPATGQNAQPETADVVVGYDGVVRAVRIVN